MTPGFGKGLGIRQERKIPRLRSVIPKKGDGTLVGITEDLVFPFLGIAPTFSFKTLAFPFPASSNTEISHIRDPEVGRDSFSGGFNEKSRNEDQ
jgi:hypothetical protein